MWRSFFSKPQKAIPESQPVYPIFIICMHGSRKNLTGDTRNNCFVAQVVTLLPKPKYQPALFLAP